MPAPQSKTFGFACNLFKKPNRQAYLAGMTPLVILFLILCSVPAYADCTNPEMRDGAVFYNAAQNVPQVCAGGNWVALGQLNPAAGGSGSCTSPAMAEGSIFYNDDHDVLQYCDGADWVALHGGGGGGSGMSVVGSVTGTQLDGAAGVAVAGNYAYVAAYDADRLTVVNISNPAAPSIAGSVTHAQLGGADSIAVAGNYAYVPAEYADRLTVVDISNPASPSIAGSVQDSTNLNDAKQIALANGYAFVTGIGIDYLTAVDISNPAAPTIAGTTWLHNGLAGVAVWGDHAYIGTYSDGNSDYGSLVKVDISDPTFAQTDGEFLFDPSKLSGGWTVVVANGYAYVAAYYADRLTVVELP